MNPVSDIALGSALLTVIVKVVQRNNKKYKQKKNISRKVSQKDFAVLDYSLCKEVDLRGSSTTNTSPKRFNSAGEESVFPFLSHLRPMGLNVLGYQSHLLQRCHPVTVDVH